MSPIHLSRIFLLFLLFLSTTSGIYGQLIEGRLIDQTDQKPIGFAHVVLLKTSDSSQVANSLSKESGRFELQAPESGDYLVHISFMGYQAFHEEVTVGSSNVNLGTVRMQSSDIELKDVEVSASAKLLTSDGEKRVFDVQNSVLAEGGSALQILETLPSIQVSEDGGITMRGSGAIRVFVNGRPSNITGDDTESVLEQFPAESIEKVELITNPSAKYEAAGAGGIINIILKKNKKDGLNTNLNTSVGTNHKYTFGPSINYRKNKWNFNLGYTLQYNERYNMGESFREDFREEVSPIFRQDYRTDNYDLRNLVRLGIDFEATEQWSLGLFSNINTRDRTRDRTYFSRNFDRFDDLDSSDSRDLREEQTRFGIESGINGGWQSTENDQRINFNLSHSYSERDRVEFFDQRYFDGDEVPISERRTQQIFSRPVASHLVILQADYEYDIQEDMQLQAGYKSNLSYEDRSQTFEEFNSSVGRYEPNALIGDDFTFDEEIHALYGQFKSKVGRINYQAGLRAEATYTTGEQPLEGNTFENNYFDLFPSASMGYELSEKLVLTAGYNRRINRPNIWQLAPFINAQDFYNLRTGNPNLNPEYTNNFEVAALYETDPWRLTTTLFHRRTTDAVTRFYTTTDISDGLITQWTNANTQDNTGLEIVNQFDFSETADATLTTSFFNAYIRGEGLDGEAFENHIFSWTANLLTNFKVGDLFITQIQTNYRGPIVRLQGSVAPIFSMNLGLKKHILDRKMTIGLNLTDVFNTRRYIVEAETQNFKQRREFDWETRILTLSVSYRFSRL